MEIGEIISKSFNYPLNNIDEFLKVAMLSLLLIIPLVIMEIIFGFFFNQGAAGIFFILAIVCAFIFSLIFDGYLVSVIKEGINCSDAIPAFDIGKNVIDSIKLYVLQFIYSIVPAIIVFILMMLLGVSTSSLKNPSAILGLGTVALIIIVIICLIFTLLLLIATLRFAKYDSLSEALSFSAVFDDLKQIGIVKVFVVYIVLNILMTVIIGLAGLIFLGLLFVGIIGLIVGTILALFLVIPYVSLVYSYAIGLLYSDI